MKTYSIEDFFDDSADDGTVECDICNVAIIDFIPPWSQRIHLSTNHNLPLWSWRIGKDLVHKDSVTIIIKQRVLR